MGRALCAVLLCLAAWTLAPARASAQAVPGTCPAALASADIVAHDFSVSFCELCSVGTVRIVVENPFAPQDDVDFSAIVVQENLRDSGLTYVPGSTDFSGTNVFVPADVEPVVSGTDDEVLTWTLPPAFSLDGRPGGPGNRERLIIDFEVERLPSLGDEGLVGADRTIEAAAELEPSCAPGERFQTSSGPGELPLREPEPQIVKEGRNLDAGQGGYSAPVYGHENDDVIWRIEVRNTGQAPLQDLVFSDSIVPGNFEIHHVCDVESDAEAAAAGASPAGCLDVGATTDVIGLDVAAVFGGGADPYIVAPAGGSGFYYLVGEITDSCTNRTNTVFDVEWGCQSEPPAGGISATSDGTTAGDSALLSTQSVESGVDIDVDLRGENLGQPMGGKGTVRIRIRNRSGGTIKHQDAIRLRDLLPPEYVVDTSEISDATDIPLDVDPAYGSSYDGMVDTLEWTNPVTGTVPLTTADPDVPLGNTDLELRLTSSTVHPEFPDQRNMIRHGDDVTILLPVVLIDPQYYDREAHVDVRTEAPGSDPPDTDPTEAFPVSNRFEIWYEEFCTPDEHHLVVDEDDTARPEDIDVEIIGDELVFILTNTGDPLPLTVALTNNGGHRARDYQAYVTFGEAMVVQSAPAGCSPTTNPPPLPEWQIPTGLPATASVYLCDRGTLSPGETEELDFEVVKNTANSFDDDLSFRADVIGEITLRDGTPLWFPAPTARGDGVLPRANDYTVDALRAKVVGYNLSKDPLGTCTEDNPPPADPDAEVQIGEECSVHVESGGWFGFQTPGFTYIAVQNVQVVDQLPDGQGYVASTDPLAQSTAAIQGVSLNPPPDPLDEGDFDWTFNTVVPDERITEKDHWFRADVTTRLLNDPLDDRASPNVHAALSRNVLTSTFDAIFFNPLSNEEELYELGPSTVGFPREIHRRVDRTVTEPLLTVTKEVCNETRFGAGPACSNFVDLADDGDAFDTYVYRVTVTNEAAAGGVARAPAYDVTVTSVTDPSDQLFVRPLDADGLDNDGDAQVDAGDAAGEGVVTDDVVDPPNGIPAEVIASFTHSDPLRRIDPGQSVELYFRVDPVDDVAPLQELVTTVTAAYDSLEGASGSQSPPQGANGEIGGARQYVSDEDDATIRIIPVEVPPKRITRLSSSSLVAPPALQPVVIGEEVEFELRTLIPVAQLRSFVIRDELPPGLSCAEAPAVDLGAAPYDAAGFVPGGVVTPTCTDTEVVWDFGNQTVTQSDRDDRRFDFAIRFIARVENVSGNQGGNDDPGFTELRNGGSQTDATVSYVNEAGSPVEIEIGEAAAVVQEPEIALTKTFSVAETDAADLPRVTVTATNTGTATAWNLRVLDDLSAVDLAYAGDIAGSDPPTADLATFGADRPLFTWAPGTGIAPGETLSFSFAVEVGIAAEPIENLDNTVQADWTSLPGRTTALNTTGQIGPDGDPTGLRNGALPSAGDPLNDHEAEASASVDVPPVTFDKVDLDPALAPEIGTHEPFQLVVALPEGTTRDLSVSDALDAGAVSYVLADDAAFPVTYAFEGIASVNGQPPDASAFLAVPAAGATGSVTWSIGDVVTASEDDLATQAISPTLRITYFGRVNNDLATNAGSTLQNGASAGYANGETGAPESLADATPPIVAIEPDLTATKALTNVTAGKAPGDPPAFDDVLQYVVTLVNGGNATAYDTNVVDTLPPELTLEAGFTPTAEIGGSPVAGFVPTPAGAPDGPLVWGRQNGDASLDIPQGSSLALTYRVRVRTPILDTQVIANEVWVDWTSLQDASVHERTGDGCPSVTPPDDYCFGPAVAEGTAEPIPPPDPVLKENTQPTAAVGEAFRWRITVPETPYAFPIHDVRILDDLGASDADLRFLGVTRVSGPGSWTPENTGDATNVVIEDTTDGIDIPAGEQIVVEITVVLEDTPGNTSGLEFTNAARYLYNWVDDDDTSQRAVAEAVSDPPMTIVGPDDLVVAKSGPTELTIGDPATYTLDVHNASDGPAWNATLTDLLPDEATGGTCGTAPSQVTAQLAESGGTPIGSPLVQDTDFSVEFLAAPDCRFTISMLTAAAVIGPDQRLIVTYEVSPDPDSEQGAVLSNVAGATEWATADPSDPQTGDDARVLTRTLTDGTPADADHEDEHTATVARPEYLFEKTVANVTSGADPATTASPGDRLRYRLRIENTGDQPLDDLSIHDALDALNDPAVFEPGTLTLVSVPGTADTGGTDPNGGAQGTGLLEVRDLAAPGPGDVVVVELEVTLAAVLPDGTVVANQAELRTNDVAIADSDDPNLNGPADPLVPGDEDRTELTITSAPDFRVEKTSAYLDGDPALLLAGERLRYTITVANVGTDDASDATLRDAIPVNTSYVAGSTTLNGAPVADGPGGLAPLAEGVPIHAPGDPTPGVLAADAAAPPANVATLVFDVVVDPAVPDGTVISNQAFVSAVAGGVTDQPSDDPDTPTPDDPTRDVVGNAPLLFAAKDVALADDVNGNGSVDPGDGLHYTIIITNSGAVAATDLVLQDDVPADTDYVPGSTLLNGEPVPDGGGFPLAAGLPVSGADATPPLPGPGEGTLGTGQTATLEFDLVVEAGVAPGTLIRNQAVVASAEAPSLPTDGDGNPATGPEPTVVVVGDGQQLAVTKQVAVVGGGAALPGSTLEYVVRVTNVGTTPASDVVITDDLDQPVAGHLVFVSGSATLDGASAGVAFADPVLTADQGDAYGPLAPGATAVLRFRATIETGLDLGTTVTNEAVVTWNDPPQTATASVSVDVGGMPGIGMLNGTLWHDVDFDDVRDAGETTGLAGWTIELLRNGQLVQSAVADANGAWSLTGLAPNDQSGDAYALRFLAPGAGAATAALGMASSPFTNGPQRIDDLLVPSGANLQGLDLPIDPGGVVYGALDRAPVAGATLSLLDAGSRAPLPETCFDDPAQQGQVTGPEGWYKFDLNFSGAACPDPGDYLIAVAPPGGIAAGPSQILAPASDETTAPFSVPACPGGTGDALPGGTAGFCEAQGQATAPGAADDTTYHLHVTLDASQTPGSSQLFNNHVPLDPALGAAVSLTKTTPKTSVSRGELVPYEITLHNRLGAAVTGLRIADRFPAGFRYVEGSARLDGVPTEPVIVGRELVWEPVDVAPASTRKLLLLLGVGAGVGEGEFTNRAQAFEGATGTPLTPEARATVRVVPDPTFACTDVLGKVFDDANRNGHQDAGERGLQGVRLVTTRGLVVTTDRHGRYHITCAVVPREDRGSNFVLKLDDRTLPSGYRMTTRQAQVKRATRGKALRMRFGAALHRVVGLDVADAVFRPGTATLRLQWRPRIDLLVEKLAESPSILRLSYIADVEDPQLVDRRVEAVKDLVAGAWQARGSEPLEIETEIFWRRGAPGSGPAAGLLRGLRSAADALPSVDAGPPVAASRAGEAAERHLPLDAPFTRWSQDPEALDTELSDTLEEREVTAERPETVKLRNVVPPIRFRSGEAEIPVSTVERLRGILESMQHLQNVRLHLVGHADDQPLSPELAATYGDNEGLSRERSGEVAEFLQDALSLPPESISYAWAGASRPVASNATSAGRALNRRVEVEVWYDEMREERAVEEVVVPAEIKRVKVCRTETVCKLRYQEEKERRARVRNLVPPLRVDGASVDVPEGFVRRVAEALENLRGERNVTVKFVGFTDDAPLTGRAERIYGTHLALSKAWARRVGLAVQDALDLPGTAVASDGHGAARPVASNETERGRALNRRIEVELWHDDPLQQLPDEPRPCPDAADASAVTRVYEPPWGRIPRLLVEDGEIRVPEGTTSALRRAMDDVAHERNVRLRFVGYTANERLRRRTALVYGDDIGLSTARARRAMEQIAAAMELPPERAEHEGRGYVHSSDVVNGGFLQGETDHVEVQVVYDALALLDDYEGVEVTPITREIQAQEPLSLNLMRITVDGEPVDDPGRSVADIQRCTDVALDGADVRFRFDDLASARRLSVTVDPGAVPVGPDFAAPARFRAYANYQPFIERSEVRVFERSDSPRAEPLAVVPVDPDGRGEWRPEPRRLDEPVRELAFVLRAYDAEGRFDETAPQVLWLVRDAADAAGTAGPADADAGKSTEAADDRALLAGYGESEPAAQNIPLENAGTVKVDGGRVPPGYGVWVAGERVPVSEDGRFVAETLLPAGMHTVEVAVLDESGNGELFLRDLEIEKSDWFYVGIADLTLSEGRTSGPADLLEGEDSPIDPDSHADGRIAFFVDGKFGDGWKLRASADTREEPIEDLFSNFLDKSPDSLLRRIDPDYYYPTFGDDSTVQESAPTSGKFYLQLSREESRALWGNFKVAYLDNELAHVDRGLYGGNVHYQTQSTTSFGEQRLVVDGFAADPGTVPSREEFRGTGGSLYFLRRQDLLPGSERVRIEVRDKDSGLVTGVVHLRYGLDYDIDYFQGRIVLSEPLSSTAGDDLLVRSGGLSGNESWLVVQYEFTPGLDEIDTLATGGNAHLWVGDHVRLGVTASRNEEEETDSSLYAADVTLRASARSWVKLQAGRSEGLVSTTLRSDDGGFAFQDTGATAIEESADAFAWRADLSVGFSDLFEGLGGRLTAYAQRLEEGYTAPGQLALTETDQLGGALDLPLAGWLRVGAKADWLVQESGLETRSEEVDLGFQITDHWSLAAGVRNELRRDDSPLVPLTQDEGERTDAVLQLGFDPGGRWNAYAFGQGTLRATQDREDNHRFGAGGAFRISDWLSLEGEVSHGDLGLAAEVGTSYQQSERTRLYLTWALENERALNGVHARQGNLVAGARTRFSDSGSVYVENRYQHAGTTGLSRAVGIDFAPLERLTVGASWESGELRDRLTHAETRRRAGGAVVGYRFDDVVFSSGVEYRFDETEQPDGSTSERTTWLFRNDLKLQLGPDWRLLGKLHHATSDSSLGSFFDGGYTEGVLGYAYRPVAHDRLDVLAKYTYFYNVPTTDQLSVVGTPAQFVQKSHVASLDVTYDLFPSLTLGAKYAYRLGQVSLDREDPEFFDSNAHLAILRGDWRFLPSWETSVEGRMLHLPDLDDRRTGALVTLYRYLGDHVKVGIGYNFTDFSDDLTDLSYDHHGVFLNLVGTL